MTTPKALKLSMTVDNVLKFLIASLVSLLTYIGHDVMQSVEKLEVGFGQMQQAITELRVELKHLTGANKTAMVDPAKPVE